MHRARRANTTSAASRESRCPDPTRSVRSARLTALHAYACVPHSWEFNFDRTFAPNADGVDECPACLPDNELSVAHPVFKWRGAAYTANEMSRTLAWKTKTRVSMRSMVTDVHRVNMDNMVRMFAARQVGREQASRFAASWMVRSALTGTVACSCTMGTHQSHTPCPDPVHAVLWCTAQDAVLCCR